MTWTKCGAVVLGVRAGRPVGVLMGCGVFSWLVGDGTGRLPGNVGIRKAVVGLVGVVTVLKSSGKDICWIRSVLSRIGWNSG